MTRSATGAILLLALAGLPALAGAQNPIQKTTQPATAELDAREIAARATPAVVAIRAFVDDREVGSGSGFLIDAAGIVVTNHHVVEEAERLEIELSSGERFRDIFYLASNADRDLALLRLPVSQLPALAIGDAAALAPGDLVYVVGNPLGLDRTFSDGLVSARRVVDGVGYIQISAPISPGSSGGPVLNAAGEVVGVATGSITQGQNLNLALPIGYAEGLLAVAGEPRPFIEVALEWRATAGPAPALDLPAATPDGTTTADQDEMPVWEASVRSQLEEITGIVAADGFEPTGEGGANMLAADAADAFTVSLAPGSYKAVGVCDGDCEDLDLAVFDDGEDLVGQDILTDAFPIVDFTVTRPASYRVVVQMVQCSTEVCFYAATLFRRR